MSLKTEIQQEFDRLAQQGVSTTAPGLLALDTTHGRLEAEFVAIDSIGCSFHALVFKTDKLAHATPDELKRLSEAACGPNELSALNLFGRSRLIETSASSNSVPTRRKKTTMAPAITN